MVGGIIILALVGALFAWIISGIRAHKMAKEKGVIYILKHFLFAALSIVFLWIVIVVPTLDCSGFLCGLGAFILFFVIGTIVILLWPLILLGTLKSKYSDISVNISDDDELLDN